MMKYFFNSFLTVIVGIQIFIFFNIISGIGGVLVMYIFTPKYQIEWYDILFSFLIPLYGIIVAIIS